MGGILRLVAALGIGIALLSGAQHLWVAAMQQRMAAVQQQQVSYLPPAQPVTADFSKMQKYLDDQQAKFHEMQQQGNHIPINVPQPNNGIPMMPGQGVPLQYYHPPGVPFR
jgi:uncharacterized protein HemX